ncbi:hypothetical protein BC835DRAFT_1424522 [Cytidiella melzeri]|nr:hypothetical protein BC835DRAFT_1424522 [Cytidiella melzeri]
MQALKKIEEESDSSSSDEEDSSCVVVSDSEDDYPTSFCLDVAEDGTLFLPASPPRSLSHPHVVSPATPQFTPPRPHVVPPVTPQPTPPRTHHRTSNSRVPRRVITPTATLSSTSSARRNLWVLVGVQTAQLRLVGMQTSDAYTSVSSLTPLVNSMDRLSTNSLALSYEEMGSPSRWMRPQRSSLSDSISSETSEQPSDQQRSEPALSLRRSSHAPFARTPQRRTQGTRSAHSIDATPLRQEGPSSQSPRTVASSGRSSSSDDQEAIGDLQEFAESTRAPAYIYPFAESPRRPSSFLFPSLHTPCPAPSSSSVLHPSDAGPSTVSPKGSRVDGNAWRSLLLPSPSIPLASSEHSGYQYFVIAWGWQPGLYESWQEAREHCSSCPLAIYQGFEDPYVARVMWEEVVSEGGHCRVERGRPYPDRRVAEDVVPLRPAAYWYLQSDVCPSRGYTVVFRGLFPGVYSLWLFAGPSVVGITGALWRGYLMYQSAMQAWLAAERDGIVQWLTLVTVPDSRTLLF